MKVNNFYLLCVLLCATSGALAYTKTPASAYLLTVAMNDPTRPDFTKNAVTKKPKVLNKHKKRKKKKLSKLFLQQTIVSGKRKIAMINGKTMTVGQVIKGAKLISINQDNVVLTYNGKRYILNLTSPSSIKEVKR